MIELFDFQKKASAQIAERVMRYLSDPLIEGSAKDPRVVSFYQALSSITASGKTAILADAVQQICMALSPRPIVFWLSKGRAVVQQTYSNLDQNGKYHHLLGDVVIRLLSEYDPLEVAQEDRPVLYFATVATFTQKDKEKGSLLIYQSDLDTAESSVWEGLKDRETSDGTQRPLIVVYDEGHNLSDLQTDLLLELRPNAFIVASATMKIPVSLSKVLDRLRSGWDEEEFTTQIDPKDVADSGLIKQEIVMGGYEASMEKTVDDLLADMKRADKDAQLLNLPFSPKAIYVCKTNIKEDNSFQKDDHKRPFGQREAPPIRIWKYLVEQQDVDPDHVVIYADLKFDKAYPPPEHFRHLKPGETAFKSLSEGDFRHVIFNLALQEGWDDPSAYFGYIDRSMGSKIQVTQVIGRLLRQPNATTFEGSETLNSAHFYVRVDKKGFFKEIVDDANASLAAAGVQVPISTYEGGTKSKPEPMEPKESREVPKVFIDTAWAVKPVQEALDELPDFRNDKVNTRHTGSRALVRQRIGDGAEAEVKWVEYESNNPVSARWIFQQEVMRRNPGALEVAAYDSAKFDAKVELGSTAAKQVSSLAVKVVDIYLDNARLRQRSANPYIVGAINNHPMKTVPFTNALHEGYSGLNDFELRFAKASDALGIAWTRNPSRSGFGIPLVTLTRSRNFYPDFLLWSASHIFAVDTTGDHLILEKTGTKLLGIDAPNGNATLHVRLVSDGQWNEKVQKTGEEGVTVWHLKPNHDVGFIHCESDAEAVETCLNLNL